MAGGRFGIIGLTVHWIAIVVAVMADGIALIVAYGGSDNRLSLAGLPCAFGMVVW
jgi:hypothetical protein